MQQGRFNPRSLLDWFLVASLAVLIGIPACCWYYITHFLEWYHYSFGKIRLPWFVFTATCLLLAVLILLAFLPKNPVWKKRCATVLAGLALALCVLNFIIPYLPLKKTAREVVKKRGGKWDERSLRECILDLRKNDPNVFSPLGGHLFLPGRPLVASSTNGILPLAHISGSKCVYNNSETGEFVMFETDEHGFRNPRGIWTPPNVDNIFLGDSMTEGCTAREGREFASLVRASHPRSINLGVGGQGPLLMLATLKEYGAALRPKRVFWCYYDANDLQNMEEEFTSSLLTRYLNDNFSQGLIKKQNVVDDVLKKLYEKELARASNEINKVDAEDPENDSWRSQIQFKPLRRFLGLTFAARIQRYYDLIPYEFFLEAAQQETKKWGGKVIFVYIPGWEHFGNPHFASVNRPEMLALIKKFGFDLIDLREVFQAQKSPEGLYNFEYQSHFNDRGNRVVADAILKYLSEHP